MSLSFLQDRYELSRSWFIGQNFVPYASYELDFQFGEVYRWKLFTFVKRKITYEDLEVQEDDQNSTDDSEENYEDEVIVNWTNLEQEISFLKLARFIYFLFLSFFFDFFFLLLQIFPKTRQRQGKRIIPRTSTRYGFM